MIRQATLLDHGSVALQNTAFTQLETTNMPHRAHLFNGPSSRGCAGPLKDLVVYPQGLDPNTFVQLGFMSARSHPFYAARMDNGHSQAA
jgi:hypothetical protein